jgi:hypothetical protein
LPDGSRDHPAANGQWGFMQLSVRTTSLRAFARVRVIGRQIRMVEVLDAAIKNCIFLSKLLLIARSLVLVYG